MKDNTDTRLPIATGRRTATILWRELRGRRVLLLVSAVLAAAGAGLELVTPAVLGRIVDDVADATADGSDHTSLWLYGLLILGSAVGAAVLGVLGILVASRVMEQLLATLREKLIRSALTMPQQRVERSGTGDLISRASDDVAQVSEALSQVVPSLTKTFFAIVLTLVGVAALDWRLAAVILVALPLYWWTLRWYLRIAPPMYAAERAAFGDRAHILLSSLRGLPTVLAFRLSGRHSGRIAEASWRVNRWALRARTVQTMFMWRVDMAFLLMLTAVLLIGYVLVGDGPGDGASGTLTIGAVTTAVLFFLRIEGPLGMLMREIDVLQSATASLARIVGVTDIPTRDATSPSTPTSPDAGTGTGTGVFLDNVTFSYDPDDPDATDVLHGVSLTVSPGEHVALVGTSGAGKSTVAALVAGIHPVTVGALSAPAHTVLISQETHVFAGTLRDNLVLGASTPQAVTDDNLVDALHRTGADDLLDMLPQGLDTPLGPQGVDLTAAQAQHLALTRVLVADPDLVILDEATADAGSDHAGVLDRAAAEVLKGRTGVVIAHRLSQAASCDRIAVMEHGRIVECGAQTELVGTGGRYAQLWRAWTTAG
ncbi:ABC transporter ATP-binding protein [Corynebacterium variabile]|uniref:Putative membrane protein n=1 Tax=Corynebacterium variabile (strain DSM 44702 / CIP 107183 / JCM 12073 / NCIMB 30131) TaxID=858619 RepID=G0HA90_CORVD|nr:ABC transporter ATP-binding protein [Corynebacterium variabile]AEK36106.1 putative membrane protein [Corynebacterium variabile DSM 44702]